MPTMPSHGQEPIVLSTGDYDVGIMRVNGDGGLCLLAFSRVVGGCDVHVWTYDCQGVGRCEGYADRESNCYGNGLSPQEFLSLARIRLIFLYRLRFKRRSFATDHRDSTK